MSIEFYQRKKRFEALTGVKPQPYSNNNKWEYVYGTTNKTVRLRYISR